MVNILAGKKKCGWAVVFTTTEIDTELTYLTFWGRPFAQYHHKHTKLPDRLLVSPYLFNSSEEALKAFERVVKIRKKLKAVNVVYIKLSENEEED